MIAFCVVLYNIAIISSLSWHSECGQLIEVLDDWGAKLSMKISFRQINMDDFELCVAARKDAYFCSFGHYDGFDDFINGYRQRVVERLTMLVFKEKRFSFWE